MSWPMRDKVCVVGVGETEYKRWGGIKRSEFQLACEAILKALDDAGLTVEDVDGFASFGGDRNEPAALANALGVPQIRFSNMFWGGAGGGGAAAVHNAALAVYSGTARAVVVYRALSQGQFGRFGQSRTGGRVTGPAAFVTPFGLMTPPAVYAMRTKRHMHEYGTTSRQMGTVAIACYKHAQRNPRAVMYGRPLDMETHQSSRYIVYPFRLYDCCLETDGACAVVLTTVERAMVLKNRAVYIMGAAQGGGFRQGAEAGNRLNFTSANMSENARDLYERAGVGPKDIDVAQIYENFTGMVLMSLEDHGFCKRGEGGQFVDDGRIEWPNGELPLNTSGGNMAEAYIHGFELLPEAVRQMRGTSTCQVDGAETCLVASGAGSILTSDLILRR